MENSVSKVRAIQVVLASVPMSKHCSDELVFALQSAHRDDEHINLGCAALSGQIKLIIDDLDIYQDFPKSAMLSRVGMAKSKLRQILDSKT